jgi:hypothetical protein
MMKLVSVRHWAMAIGGLIMLTAGCGKPAAELPPLGMVSGVVTLNGEPLPKASLFFVPTGAEDQPSNAVTDEAGRYELRYGGSRAGALIGSHRVEIRTGGEGYDKDGNFFESKERLPAKYHSQSRLTAEVVAGPNEINFELLSR